MERTEELQALISLLGDEAIETLKALAERKRQASAQAKLASIAESVKEKVEKALGETGFDAVSFTYRKTGQGLTVEVRFVRAGRMSADTGRKSSGPMADQIRSVKIIEGNPMVIFKDGRMEPFTWNSIAQNILGYTNRANSSQIRKALRARGLLAE